MKYEVNYTAWWAGTAFVEADSPSKAKEIFNQRYGHGGCIITPNGNSKLEWHDNGIDIESYTVNVEKRIYCVEYYVWSAIEKKDMHKSYQFEDLEKACKFAMSLSDEKHGIEIKFYTTYEREIKTFEEEK